MLKKNKDGKISVDESNNTEQAEPSVVKASEFRFSLPKQVMVGFYANIKKSDLKSYLRAKAHNHMTPDNTYYGIKKFQNGYLWELHEGGSGKGILSSLAEKLKVQDNIIIETSDKNIRVLRKAVGEGISSFQLNSEDVVTPTEGIVYKDKLSPVKTTGYGFFVFSAIFASLGVFSAVGLLIFKYGLFHESEPLMFVKENKELPVFQMDHINNVINDPNAYLYQLTYRKGTGWYMDKKLEQPSKKVKDKKLEKELSKQLESLKDKMNLQEGPNKAGESNE
jgi:hypothetical protein